MLYLDIWQCKMPPDVSSTCRPWASSHYQFLTADDIISILQTSQMNFSNFRMIICTEISIFCDDTYCMLAYEVWLTFNHSLRVDPTNVFLSHTGIQYLLPMLASLTVLLAAFLKGNMPILWSCLLVHGTSSPMIYLGTSWQHTWVASRPTHNPIPVWGDGAPG